MVRKQGSRALGAFNRVPDPSMGAVAARLVAYMRNDTRRIVYFVPYPAHDRFCLPSRYRPLPVWFVPIMGGSILMMVEGNNLAYDGRG